jgi:tetratricopeptide repeat protein 21B
MSAPGIRTPLTPDQRARLSRRSLEPSTHERASVYLLLAEAHARLWAAGAGQRGQHQHQHQHQQQQQQECPKARRVLDEAVREFAGTSEEVRLYVFPTLGVSKGI